MTEMHKEPYESKLDGRHKGDTENTRECFQRAIRDAEKLKDEGSEMEAKWRLGMVYEVLGKLDEALGLYDEALEYFSVRDKKEVQYCPI